MSSRALVEFACGLRGLDDPLEEVGPFQVLGRDVECLDEESHGLPEAAEGLGALGSAAQSEPRLRAERRRLLGIRGGSEGGEVVGRERAGQLVVAERLEEPGRGQVAGLAGRGAKASSTRPRGSAPGRTRTGRARATARRAPRSGGPP